jgi:hypothetical protein
MFRVRSTKLYKEGMKKEAARRKKMSAVEKKKEDRLADKAWRLQHPKKK